jgi:hypothetical protein
MCWAGGPVPAAVGNRSRDRRRNCLVAEAVRGLTSRAESGVHPSCARCCPGAGPGSGRAGEVGGLMCEAAVAESVTIAAVPERVGLARAFVAGVLGESHPLTGMGAFFLRWLRSYGGRPVVARHPVSGRAHSSGQEASARRPR